MSGPDGVMKGNGSLAGNRSKVPCSGFRMGFERAIIAVRDFEE
jgi:histidyl-tRNA synthetase